MKLQKLKQNTLFVLFHFFCIIMLRNCMIIDAKIKYFSILKSTAKSSNLELSLVFHFASIAFRLPASLPSSTLSFAGSLPPFLLKCLSSAFATSSVARIASHSSSHIKYSQFRGSFCNYINGEIRNKKRKRMCRIWCYNFGGKFFFQLYLVIWTCEE